MRSILRAVPLAIASLAFGCAEVDDADDGVLSDLGSALESETSGAAAGGSAPVVKVKQGKLQGTLVDQTTRVFLGIPYAKPPVGALRFAPPQPAASWSGTRPATSFGPSCVQPPGGLAAPGPQSEDCLTLNVYAPRTGTKLPVMVFIHGGAFVAGGSVQYDARRLSEEGKAVVVTLNYRLGALGLLSLPALDAQRGSVPSGNDAFRDQQLALQWVKSNAAAFGGDAANVTLFGESAGSMSTCIQMVSPLSRTLAKRFVMQSATCVAGLPISTVAQAQTIGGELAQNFCEGASGADLVACLRTVPAAELVAWGAERGISGAGWAPVVNPADPLLPQHPKAMIAAGNYNKGNIIVGSNAREWGLFQAIGASPVIADVAQLHATIDATFGPIAPLVKQQYPATDATANTVFVRLMTDYLFRCPARALARQTSAKGSTVYLYHFEEGAAYHAFELPYVFGNPNPNLGAPTLVEPLRKYIQTGLGNYARTGTPSAAGLTGWPKYSIPGDQYVSLKNPISVGSGLAKADCDFWDYIASLQP